MDPLSHLDNDRARCLLVPYRFLSVGSEAMRIEDIFSFPYLEGNGEPHYNTVHYYTALDIL